MPFAALLVRVWILVLVGALTLQAAQAAHAEDPSVEITDESRTIYRSPLVVGVAAGSFLADSHARRIALELAEKPGLRSGARLLSDAGGPLGLAAALGGLWLVDEQLGRDAAIAVAAASAAAYAVKVVVGRARPDAHEVGARPFTFDDEWNSFPSGHSAAAFALAAAVGEHRPEWRTTVYALAALVAASRVVLDRHWLSDSVAGAVLGDAIGTAVARGPGVTRSWSW